MIATLQQAHAFLDRGEVSAALSFLQSTLPAAESDVPCTDETLRAYLLTAAIAFDLQQFTEAEQWCRTLITQGFALTTRRIDTQAPAALAGGYGLLGRLLERQARWDAALEAYCAALYLDGGNAAPFRWGQALVTRLGRIADYACTADIVFATGAFVPGFTNFHGGSQEEKALGGSESAAIEMARCFCNMGKTVQVFAPCQERGVYDGVEYRPNVEFFFAAQLAAPRCLIVSRSDFYLHPRVTAARRLFWVHDIAEGTHYYDNFSPDQCRFDRLLCLSRYHRDTWQRRFAVPAAQIWLTTNGFSERYFPNARFVERRPQLVYFSRPDRGLDVCLSVFARLRARLPELTLLVSTYNPFGPGFPLETQIPCYDLLQSTPGVCLASGLTKPQLADELRTSFAMLYPNTLPAETSCIAAIEAMAAGCPVIASDRGALPETVPHGIGGLLVPYTDDHAVLADRLVEQATTVLDDRAALQMLSERAFAYAQEKYPWSKVAREWLTMIETL